MFNNKRLFVWTYGSSSNSNKDECQDKRHEPTYGRSAKHQDGRGLSPLQPGLKLGVLLHEHLDLGPSDEAQLALAHRDQRAGPLRQDAG